MSCESYDLHLTTLSPIHIGSGKSYSCCEFVPAKAKSKGQIVKIIKRVNLTNYYSSLSDDRKDTFLASLTNSNFELKQFDKKIKKDFVRYQCIDNSRVDFINEVQEHIKTSDKLYIPGSSIKGAIRTAIFYDLLTEKDMDKIGRDISSNRRNNSFLSNDLLKKHFTSGFGNDAQYNIFRFMQVADTTTTNLPRIEQVLAVMATDDRRKNQFYSRHGKVVKSYLETIGANKNLLSIADAVFKKEFQNFEGYSEDDLITSDFGLIPKDWYYNTLDEISDVAIGKTPPRKETWWFSEKEGVKWVSIKDLGNSGTYVFETSEYLTEEAIEKFNVKLIPEDTIILSFKLTVGRLGITTEEMVTNEAIAHFKLDENSLISKEYLYLYLKNFNYEELGSTSSIAKAINSKIVKMIPVLIPTNNKMEEFKKLFENIFNEIKSNQLEINNLTKLRDTLLPKLMSGEIDVSKINCDLELKYNYMKYLFNQIHTPMSKSVV